MDFWAQHKDFILKILAGVGVFLVALIVRGITYGDELEKAQNRNAVLAGQIRSTEVAPVPKIMEMEADARRLKENAKDLAKQIGWDLGDERLKQTLIERVLRYTRRYARDTDDNVKRAAEDFRAALRDNLNGGFGQLRLMIRQQLAEEASERNIKVGTGVGFDTLTNIEPDEVLQYLMQLELVARVVRYAIDARIDSIEEIVITQGGTRRPEVIAGANPEFIEEYEVTITFTTSQDALRAIVDRLEQEAPRPAITNLAATWLKRPENHLSVVMKLLATAANPDVEFAVAKEKS